MEPSPIKARPRSPRIDAIVFTVGRRSAGANRFGITVIDRGQSLHADLQRLAWLRYAISADDLLVLSERHTPADQL